MFDKVPGVKYCFAKIVSVVIYLFLGGETRATRKSISF